MKARIEADEANSQQLPCKNGHIGQWRTESRGNTRRGGRFCRACTNDKARQYYADDKTKFIKRQRRWWLKSQYNLTLDEFAQIIEQQGNTCRICFQPFETTPHVDHDHITGKVRGLICGPCNSVLGLAHDEMKILQAAVAYLQEHQQGLPTIGDINSA